jgi:hypothetical protein
VSNPLLVIDASQLETYVAILETLASLGEPTSVGSVLAMAEAQSDAGDAAINALVAAGCIAEDSESAWLSITDAGRRVLDDEDAA